MHEQIHSVNEELFLEIARYLEAVDVYRAERCEPTWLPESPPSAAPGEHLRAARVEPAPSAH